MNYSWFDLKNFNTRRKLVPGCFWIIEPIAPLPLPHFLPLRLVLSKTRKGIYKSSKGRPAFPEVCLPDTLKVDRDRCARRAVSFPHAHVPIISQHPRSLNSLGSVDPLKGQSPRSLETPPVLRLAFMLHLVGEERCQGKDWDLVHNWAHSGVCSSNCCPKP